MEEVINQLYSILKQCDQGLCAGQLTQADYDDILEDIDEVKEFDCRLQQLSEEVKTVNFSDHRYAIRYIIEVHGLIHDYQWILQRLYDVMLTKMWMAPALNSAARADTNLDANGDFIFD